MEKAKTPRKKWLPKKKRTWVIVILVLALLAFAVVQIISRKTATQETVTQRTGKVTQGTIRISVTGSGPLTPQSKMSVTADTSAAILEILHQDGDTVKQGDILYVLDDTDARKALEKVQNNLDDAADSNEDVLQDVASLSVSAPIPGIVTGLTSKVGDTVNKGAVLLTLSDTRTLTMTASFGASDMAAIHKGMAATVTLPDIMTTITGTVTRVGNSAYVNTAGSTLVDVDISIKNPGALIEGMTAEAALSIAGTTVTAMSNSTLSYEKRELVKSDAGGTLTAIHVHNNDTVRSGASLMTLQNDDLVSTVRSSETKVTDLQLQLEDAQAVIDDCTILAPMDGVVTGIDQTVGDAIKSGTVLCSVLNPQLMEFSVSIDELDIAKIKTGLDVSIMLDALEDTATKPLTGKVGKIAIEGTSQNGVTNYPVTILVDADDRLKSGMNADGEIIIENKENVLMVPVEAVQKMGNRSIVYVLGTVADGSATTGGMRPGGAFPEGMTPPEGGFPEGMTPPEGGFPEGMVPGDGSGAATGGAFTPGSGRRNRDNTTGTTAGVAGDTGTTATGGTGASGFTGLGRAGRNNAYYANATPVFVETGVNNEQYVEIISGLSLGQEIVLPQLAAASAITTGQSGFGGLMGGGGGAGGIPGGAGAITGTPRN